MAQETELTLYVQLQDPNFPPVDGSETWIQYESKLEGGADIRVRAYDAAKDGYRFIQTLKIRDKTAKIDSADEYNCPIPEGFARGFILAASSEQHKRRDYFKSTAVTLKLGRGDEVEVHEAPELTIEVDRFIKPDGSYSDWGKVDIEVDDLIEWIKSNYGVDGATGYHIELDKILPCKALRIIDGKTQDPEEKEILSQLWETDFKRKIFDN